MSKTGSMFESHFLAYQQRDLEQVILALSLTVLICEMGDKYHCSPRVTYSGIHKPLRIVPITYKKFLINIKE